MATKGHLAECGMRDLDVSLLQCEFPQFVIYPLQGMTQQPHITTPGVYIHLCYIAHSSIKHSAETQTCMRPTSTNISLTNNKCKNNNYSTFLGTRKCQTSHALSYICTIVISPPYKSRTCLFYNSYQKNPSWWFQLSSHLKNMLVKLGDHFSKGRGENKNIFELPPSSFNIFSA